MTAMQKAMFRELTRQVAQLYQSIKGSDGEKVQQALAELQRLKQEGVDVEKILKMLEAAGDKLDFKRLR